MSSDRLLSQYLALSPSSRGELPGLLQSIIDVSPLAPQTDSRCELIQSILNDLSLAAKDSNGRLSPKDAAQALLAVKSLGKHRSGSELIGSKSNLSLLLQLFASYKDNQDASNEVLRCIANALLLVDQVRSTLVQPEVGGGDFVVDLFQKSTNPERLFLCSRILFLCTASSSSSYIRTLVERKNGKKSETIIEVIASKLDFLRTSILGSEKFAREAMTDLLKFTFNLLLHYPKITQEILIADHEISTSSDHSSPLMGDYWSERLDSLLSPLLKLFNTLPPTFPSPLASPLTHVIHALITIPVLPSLQSKWFPSIPKQPVASSSKLPSPAGTPPPHGTSQMPSPTSRSGSPISAGAKESKGPGAFDRAMSKLTAGRKSLSRSSSPQPPTSEDTLLRAHDLLDVTLSHFMPGDIDPDDTTVRERCRQESENSLDDIVCPLVILITKLCKADDDSRRRMRQWLLPDDLDRTHALESRTDLLGRCLRLLASVHHVRMKDATGEMLYAICDSDPSLLASYVGYGNVAGFLFNKGFMNAPPRSTSSSAPTMAPSGLPIDPITGTVKEEPPPLDMTDEEKEREAEKLFVLFDRLEKSGALPPSQNPLRKAVQEGKLG